MDSRSDNEPEAWVSLARLAKTQGRRGELAADLWTDVPGRFQQVTEVSLAHPSGRRQTFQIERHRYHQGRVVLGFTGIDDMDSAAAWIGAEVQVPRAQRASAPAGAYYLDDLAGCQLFDRGRLVGRVEAVDAIAGAAPLLRVSAAGRAELLIPFAAAYLDAVSLASHRIEMHLPEGLLEINVPSSGP